MTLISEQVLSSDDSLEESSSEEEDGEGEENTPYTKTKKSDFEGANTVSKVSTYIYIFINLKVKFPVHHCSTVVKEMH